MSRPRLAFIVAACVSTFLVSAADPAFARGPDVAEPAREQAPRLRAASADDLLPFTESDGVTSPGSKAEGADDASPSAAHEAQKDRAKAFVMRATHAALAGRWLEAEALFGDAWARDKTYDTAGNLGDVELRNKKPVQAATHLRFCLDALPPSVGSELRARTEARFQEARSQVGSILIKVSEPGADVSIDGVSVGASPIEGEVFVEPGPHRVRGALAGFDASEQTALVEKGGSKGVTLTLFPTPPPPVAPLMKALPPLGPVALVTIAPPERPSLASVFRSPAFLSTSALTLASAALGIGLHVASSNLEAEAVKMRAALDRKNGPEACYDEPALATECAELRSATNSGAAMSIGSKVAFGLGGAALSGAVIYVILGRSVSDTKTGTTVLPSVTANAGGLLVSSVW